MRLTVVCLLLTMSASLSAADDEIQFNRDIRPILSNHCFACHGPDANHREADLRLDQREGAIGTSEEPGAIVPGDSAKSPLVARILSDDEYEVMPPPELHKPLNSKQKSLLKRWIDQGAKYEAHWSLVPPSRPDVPEVADRDWSGNPVDRFLRDRMETEGVQPSSPADRRTLLRRIALDLTGLPPTHEERERFLDPSVAPEQIVEHYLSSDHFGERMAVYWLDLVRYATTVGYHGDQVQVIEPYRDWVIHAFNQNMPFDQFTKEQLAGDLLTNPTEDQIIASGYNRLLQTTHEGGLQQKEYLAKYSADRVRNVSGVWMGATLGCAECHDHKYDPYLQKDFYSLAAFFADVDDMQTFRGTNSNPTRREPERNVISPLHPQKETLRKRYAELNAQRTPLAVAVQNKSATDAEKKAAQEKLKTIDAELATIKPFVRRTMITKSVAPRPIRLLNRGDWMDDSGALMKPETPEVLPTPDVTGADRLNRLHLAEWLTRKDHPQTARVFVNRMWYLFYGEGFTKNLDDMGSQGDWPSHPQLLDWLAVEFVESGWDVKHLLRTMLNTRAYRQTSVPTDALLNVDPENRLFARQNAIRLPAEFIRDQALAVSGLLNAEMGGGSARPYQPAGYYVPLNFPRRTYKSDGNENQYRRGVYMHWQRQFLHPMLKAFDAPSREECTAKRPISNTPLAALTTLNDPSFVEASRAFAGRILKSAAKTDSERATLAFEELLVRKPSPAEMKIVLGLVGESRSRFRADTKAATAFISTGLSKPDANLDPVELATWTTLTRAMLNLSETLTRN